MQCAKGARSAQGRTQYAGAHAVRPYRRVWKREGGDTPCDVFICSLPSVPRPQSWQNTRVRILAITRTYRVTGGADTYALALQAVLEAHGHTVIPFAAQHPANRPTPWARYFPPDLGFSAYGARDRLRALARALTGGLALAALRCLLDEHPVDLAHVHTTFHQVMPPAAFALLRRRGIPVVMTVHDYKLVCPTYWQYVAGEDAICQRCAGQHFYHAIFRGCAGRGLDGLLKGVVVALEAYWARWTRAYADVACLICPSEAMRAQIANYGFPRERLEVLPYLLPNTSFLPRAKNPAGSGAPCSSAEFLFVGRLVPEKGALWLAQALVGTELRLTLVGDGPQRAAIEALTRCAPNLQCVGWADQEEVRCYMQQATALVVPSLWPDNSPMVIYEACALGLPVVAARVGGIPELVRDGENGLLFERGDRDGLLAALRRLARDAELRARLSAGARARAAEWSPKRHLEKLLAIYERAVQTRRPRRQ